MLFPTFGLQLPEGWLSPVDRLHQNADEPLDSISVRVVLNEYYESAYAIYDHDSNPDTRPLASVALHMKENASDFSKLYRTISRFATHQIHEKFGLSISEFLSLPHDVVEKMFQVSATMSSKETKSVDAALEAMKNGKDK